MARVMPYYTTIPFSPHVFATEEVTSSSADSGSGGGSGSTSAFELIVPNLTSDYSSLFPEQAGDTPPGSASDQAKYDNGFMLFDGFCDPASIFTDTRWLVYDATSQNGFATVVFNMQFARTISKIAFYNIGVLESMGSIQNADTIQAWVSNSSSVPTASSTQIVNLTSQAAVFNTGLIDVLAQESAQYIRIKVSHSNSSNLHIYGLTGVRLYGAANDYKMPILLSPFPYLTADNGKFTVSGTITGQPWHTMDGTRTWSEANATNPVRNGWLASAPSGTATMVYDFGSAKTVTSVKFYNYQEYFINNEYLRGTSAVTIATSSDNSTYTDVATDTGKGTVSVWRTNVGTPVSARYLRFTFTKLSSNNDANVGMQEMEIYGLSS